MSAPAIDKSNIRVSDLRPDNSWLGSHSLEMPRKKRDDARVTAIAGAQEELGDDRAVLYPRK